jgi:hypothetical protein
VKPSPFVLVSVNLDLITNPEPIRSVKVRNSVPMIIGNALEPNARGYKVKKWGGNKEGNMNARWRRRLRRRKSGIMGKAG